MKQIFFITLIISLSLIVSACSDGGKNAEQISLPPQMSEEARLNAEATKLDDDRIEVTGKTNLPDSTKLLISLSNETLGFDAKCESVVNNGQFSTGPLGPSSGLIAGNYKVKVLMPLPIVQPERVQSILGKEGEHLTGSLVQDSSLGGKTVEYSFSYITGSTEAIVDAVAEHIEFVSDVRSTIEELLNTGRVMEQYRNTDDLSGLKICGEMMRENQPKAKSVRAKASTLPVKYFDLKVASIDTYPCVSCSRTAIEACDRIAEALGKQ